MTGTKFFAGCALTSFFVGASFEAKGSGVNGNPEVKAHWLVSEAPPEVYVVSATVIACAVGVAPRRLATDVELVEDAVIGPIPQGSWCDLRLVVEGAAGNRQILMVDIEDLSEVESGILWLDGAAVGALSAEVDAEPLDD